MRVINFSSRQYDEPYFREFADKEDIQIKFVDSRLSIDTVSMATGFDVVCGFVNDSFDRQVLSELHRSGVQMIALRCAGFNNCDLNAANEFNLPIVRVPSYSPYSVAEHAFALLLAVNRKTHKAYNRVREGNYELNGLLGFDLHGKTIGLVGTGNIGQATARIANGFGMSVLASDIQINPDLAGMVSYVDFAELCQRSDIVSLHCPLNDQTHHLIDSEAIDTLKPGAILINTSRGGLIDTDAVIRGLKNGKIGGLGIDVYENESSLFFEDRSSSILRDDLFARLMTFPNVLVTGHQGFFTREALREIARTTIASIRQLREHSSLSNQIQIHEKSGKQ